MAQNFDGQKLLQIRVGKILTNRKFTNAPFFHHLDCQAYCTHAAFELCESIATWQENPKTDMHMHLHV